MINPLSRRQLESVLGDLHRLDPLPQLLARLRLVEHDEGREPGVPEGQFRIGEHDARRVGVDVGIGRRKD